VQIGEGILAGAEGDSTAVPRFDHWLSGSATLVLASTVKDMSL